MLFIILGLIIGVAIGIYEDCGDTGVYGFLGALIGLIIYVIGGMFIGAALPTEETVTSQTICSMKDGNEIEGSYFLFSGYVDEELTYRYVVETEKGKYVESIKAETGVYLKEGDFEPHVEYHRFVFKSDWYYWFAINVNCFENYTTFYVPTETVTNEFEVNLE
jgi:hypothetical protein